MNLLEVLIGIGMVVLFVAGYKTGRIYQRYVHHKARS